MATTAVRALIRDQRMHQALGVMESSMRENSITMDRALKDALSQGLIAYETAERFVTNPEGFRRLTSVMVIEDKSKKKGFGSTPLNR